MPSKKNQPAFPGAGRGSGLTKREYAAIHIFAVLASDETWEETTDAMVKEAISGADRLFALLNSRDGGSNDAYAPPAVPE